MGRSLSQYHLFRSLRVSDEFHSHNFATFGAFLQNDASPRFCTQVRSLVIRGDQGSYDCPLRTLLDRTLLTSILKKLPRLSALTICDVRLQDADYAVCRRFKLDELTLSSVGSSRDSPRSILGFLDMFAEIGMLYASFVDSWYEPALSQGLLRPLGQSLDPLCLRVYNAHLRGWTTVNCLLDILRKSNSVRTLRSLNVECSDAREVASVGELIRDVGKSVSHVSIDMSIVSRDEHDPQQLAKALGLSNATELESLRICIFPNLALPLPAAMLSVARASECLVQLIASLSPTVKRITLELGPSDIVHDRSSLIDWDALSALDWGRFIDFQNFDIVLSRAGSPEVAEDIRRKLRVPNEQGILDVVWEKRR